MLTPDQSGRPRGRSRLSPAQHRAIAARIAKNVPSIEAHLVAKLADPELFGDRCPNARQLAEESLANLRATWPELCLGREGFGSSSVTAPWVLVAHLADGVRVIGHQTKQAAKTAGMALRNRGLDAWVYSREDAERFGVAA